MCVIPLHLALFDTTALAHDFIVPLMQSRSHLSCHLLINIRAPETLLSEVSITSHCHHNLLLTIMIANPENASVV